MEYQNESVVDLMEAVLNASLHHLEERFSFKQTNVTGEVCCFPPEDRVMMFLIKIV